MKKGMVKIRWSDGVWVVSFGKNLFLETSNYIKAYFWKKYEKEIDRDFVLDYMQDK